MSNKIKVMIVDDSLSIRLLLKGIIDSAPDMDVVAVAPDAIQAKELLRTHSPDVITLDVEMPHMDGLTFLQKLMKLRPIPVVMISTLTQKGSATAIKALEFGAVDIVGKPSQKASDLESYTAEIITKVREAAHAKVGQAKPKEAPSSESLKTLEVTPTMLVDQVYPRTKKELPTDGDTIIAIGSSTGGPGALKEVIPPLPENSPPIVVVQHMSALFTKALAESLNAKSHMTVVEAADGMPIEKGHVYIAPGGKHLAVRRTTAGKYKCSILDLYPVNRHRPSVDVLFRSTLEAVGKNAVGVILTGMGDDGARCLKEMKENGALTLSQTEDSCVVYGMPRAAERLGAATKVLNLEKITKELEGYSK